MKYFNEVRDTLIKYISQLLWMYMTVIFIFSVIPSFESGLNSGIRTHAVVYSLLSVFMVLYFKINKARQPWLKGVFLAGTFGLLMEIIQYFIPFRKFEVEDIILNYISAFFAIFPGYFVIKLLNINSLKR